MFLWGNSKIKSGMGRVATIVPLEGTEKYSVEINFERRDQTYKESELAGTAEEIVNFLLEERTEGALIVYCYLDEDFHSSEIVQGLIGKQAITLVDSMEKK